MEAPPKFLESYLEEPEELSVEDLVNQAKELVSNARPGIFPDFVDTNLLQDLESKLDRPFKVGVIGQFRSGKSTLINALVGGHVAFVDEEEATAHLCRYYWAKDPIAYFIRENGRERLSVQEALFQLRENRNNAEWRDAIYRVDFGFPNFMLRRVEFWDTPGLGGSSFNQKISEAFVNETDAAIWVFDSDTIGRADIVSSMDALVQRGLVVIGLVNKAEDLDRADFDRAVDFVKRAYPRAKFSTFIPFCAKNALASLKLGERVVAYGDATGDDGGLSLLYAELEHQILHAPASLTVDAAAAELKAWLQCRSDDVRQVELEVENRLKLFRTLLSEVEGRLRERYRRMERLYLQSYRDWLEPEMVKSMENAIRHASLNELHEPEPWRRLRERATGLDVTEPILNQLDASLEPELRAITQAMALDLEEIMSRSLTQPERGELRRRLEERGYRTERDEAGASQLLDETLDGHGFGAQLGMTQWELLLPRPQWTYVLDDVRPFRRPTRPPGSGEGPKGPTEEERDAKRVIFAYFSEAEPLLDDEIRLATDRARLFAQGVFFERLGETLLDGKTEAEYEATIAETTRLREQFDALDKQLTLRNIELEPLADIEMRMGQRDAVHELWSNLVLRPRREAWILDGDLSPDTLPGFSALKPGIPLRIITWREALASATAGHFKGWLEALRMSREGKVSLLAPIPLRPDLAPPRGHYLVLDDEVYSFSVPIAEALGGRQAFRMERVDPSEIADWLGIWNRTLPGFRAVML